MNINSIPSSMRGKVNYQTRRVVVLAVSPSEELDIVGPVTVFAKANEVLGRSSPAYETELVTSDLRGIVRGACGLDLLARGHYRELTSAPDTLLVAGGPGIERTQDPSLITWLQMMAKSTRRLGSICTGSFLLAQAGLLTGKRVTTHWRRVKELAKRYPEITVDPMPIWIRQGNIYTSAGITAGTDLALGLVEEDHGSGVALAVAREMVMFLRRSGGQPQFSASLSAQASERKSIRELQVWLADNLMKNLSVTNLALRTAMSPRNFARVFVRELGITPARYVEGLRVEAARRWLEQTDKGMEEIALACGLGNAHLMRHAFLRIMETTPSAYREKIRRQHRGAEDTSSATNTFPGSYNCTANDHASDRSPADRMEGEMTCV
jgi:transcriptional regulator GlxA family with amidase domain